jgi:hypothetical protein
MIINPGKPEKSKSPSTSTEGLQSINQKRHIRIAGAEVSIASLIMIVFCVTVNGLPQGKWGLVWNDEFSGSAGAPPASHWLPGLKWANYLWRDAVISMDQAYLDGNGHLVMRAEYKNGQRLCSYLTTSGDGWPESQWATFGPGDSGIYIECRANVSQFKAFAAWWAFWLFDYTNPYSGDPANGSEIDIMEYVPFSNSSYTLMNLFHTAVIWGPSVQPPNNYGQTAFDQSQYHTWGIEWYKDRQIFYIDTTVFWTNTQGVSTHAGHGIRLTIEISNGNPTNLWGHPVGKFEDNPVDRLPSYAYVDYVRVYQRGVSSTAAQKQAPASGSPTCNLNLQLSSVVMFDIRGRRIKTTMHQNAHTIVLYKTLSNKLEKSVLSK